MSTHAGWSRSAPAEVPQDPGRPPLIPGPAWRSLEVIVVLLGLAAACALAALGAATRWSPATDATITARDRQPSPLAV